jgi:hypothetical protein
LAPKAEHLATIDHGDMDAFAIQNIEIHDRPPMQEYPDRRLRSLAGDSETNRVISSPSPAAQLAERRLSTAPTSREDGRRSLARDPAS